MLIQPNRIANRKRKQPSPAESPPDNRTDQSFTTAAVVEERVRNRKSHRRKARPASGMALGRGHGCRRGRGLVFFHLPGAKGMTHPGGGPGPNFARRHGYRRARRDI